MPRPVFKNRFEQCCKAANRGLRWYPRALRMSASALVCLLFLFVWLMITARPNERLKPLASSDYWVHSTVLRNVTDIIESNAPLGPALSPLSYKHKRPYFLILGALGSIFGLHPQTVLLGMGFFNTLLLAAGIVLFVRRFVSRRAPAGLFLLTALLFWGPGFFHSNEYHLSVLPIAASFPSTFSFALSLMALAGYGRVCAGGGRPLAVCAALGLVALFGAETLLDHPRTFFSFFLPTALLTAFFFPSTRTRKFLALAGLIPLFLLATLWPWSGELCGTIWHLAQREARTEAVLDAPEDSDDAESVHEVPARDGTRAILQDRSLKTYEKHYAFDRIWKYAPALFLGFPCVILLFLRRNRRAVFIASAAILFWSFWAIGGYVFHTALGYRWLYFYGFFMQIATAWLIWSLAAHPRWKPVSVLLAAMVLAVGWNTAHHAADTHLERPIRLLPREDIEQIASLTGRDRIFADARVSHYMGAFGMRPAWEGRIRQAPPSPAIADWLEARSVENLLRALESSGAEWALEDKETKSLGITEPVPALETVLETSRYILYRISFPAGGENGEPPAPSGDAQDGAARILPPRYTNTVARRPEFVDSESVQEQEAPS